MSATPSRPRHCPLQTGGNRADWSDVVPAGAEPDQWGYVETEPLPVCTLRDCTEIEAGLVVHWCDALNEADPGFSGYRENGTETISRLDRLYGTCPSSRRQRG